MPPRVSNTATTTDRCSELKDPLQVGDRVGSIASPHQPKLGAATAEQGAEVIRFDQDAAANRQANHFGWGGGCIELPGEIGISIHLMAEVIEGIQQGLRGGIHAGVPRGLERYQGC